MPPKDDPETAAVRKELDDLLAKIKACIRFYQQVYFEKKPGALD